MGSSRVYFYAERPFTIVYNIGNPQPKYVQVRFPAGYSSRFWPHVQELGTYEKQRSDIKVLKEIIEDK